MRTVALHTLGCKLNYTETSSIARQFVERGYQLVDSHQPSDIFVLNTCSVTERADKECRQLIRRALRQSEDTYVVVLGCYAQLSPDEIAAIEGVDLIMGAKEKFMRVISLKIPRPKFLCPVSTRRPILIPPAPPTAARERAHS
jgi:threonylcarbamoyladenosine tRNA methylthiotransferase MtaB